MMKFLRLAQVNFSVDALIDVFLFISQKEEVVTSPRLFVV